MLCIDNERFITMIRLASSPTPHVNSPAKTSQIILNSADIMRTLASSAHTPAATNVSLEKCSVKVGGSIGSPVELLGSGANSTQSVKLSTSEWNELFFAITARLRQVVGVQTRGELANNAQHAKPGIQKSILECVEALNVLHTALTLERNWRQQLDKEVFDVQVAIAQALVDLAAAPQSALETISKFPVLNEMQSVTKYGFPPSDEVTYKG